MAKINFSGDFSNSLDLELLTRSAEIVRNSMGIEHRSSDNQATQQPENIGVVFVALHDRIQDSRFAQRSMVISRIMGKHTVWSAIKNGVIDG